MYMLEQYLCVCVCVYAHVHMHAHTDKYSFWAQKAPGEYPNCRTSKY